MKDERRRDAGRRVQQADPVVREHDGYIAATDSHDAHLRHTVAQRQLERAVETVVSAAADQ